ncbi:hypothetical protein B0I75DRAFT_134742 [Yarrowia lipolytica]|jgi:hypothetical protein|uniref:YALI0E14839p n=2 Tax=Yarrowia lipolytica TaxID=4952 RepID=Q6C5V4_YARLI|nr:YALI0E14839p [Yarrowia lipolytica CLIB122]AOW05430.1 hypothetical protein YALI1_E17829g [Yarrowia lipolytica]KAB8282069.1 hypothetical protein BKA91DRAFT_174445 [Yarrowia lipolytica]KAE8171115.1 hypothetical protein BKA90DRAFT_30530 [Yarrowia lipolytica]KAJ8056936.1 hypothetical protein LXG23DRAFT_53644 [Yarrowia lipolytica]QNP98982.1 Hypothetical protein YALI2_E00298g [Yarrowia lipolytica]|eukprot:XP_503958.1 YALI0E14839p [Yarrowia lipolytica CLIB122]
MQWFKRSKQALSADELLSQLQDDQQLTFAQFAVIVKPFSARDAHECTMAFRILHTINANLKETQSWPFQLLRHCDLEHVTGKSSWLDRIRKRPQKPTSEGGTKTAFNINIANKVHKQCGQMKTQMQQWDIKHLQNVTGKLLTNGSFTSDASSVLITLVLRILSRYSELEEQLDLAMSRATLIKINYELTEKLSKELENQGEEEDEINPLLVAYRSFVKQLLSELDTDSDNRQDLLQVVKDLEDMYKQYAASTPKKSSPRKKSSTSRFPTPSTPKREASDPFDYMDSPTHTQTESFSSMSNSVNSLFSSTSKASSTVSDELPNLLHAFDMEYVKQQRQRRELDGVGMSSPQSMTSSISSKSLSSSKSFSKLNPTHSSPLVAASPLQTSHIAPMPNSSPAPSHLDVQMINNRMMVKTASGYQDMQEWVMKQNQEAALRTTQPAVKSASDYIVTVPKESVPRTLPSTGTSFLSNIFGNRPLAPPVPLEKKELPKPQPSVGPTTSLLAKSLSEKHSTFQQSAFETSYRQEMNDFE